MQQTEEYHSERLDHLGIVAGGCQEIGLAAWLDALAPDQQRVVSYGTATVAMILNGLGLSNRPLYLVPQFFESKPVTHLLGEGISADMLNDDSLGHTLDWLYEQDVTTVFAGIAHQARQLFGVNKPTARPTMHWVFQGFEGIELLQIHTTNRTEVVVLRLQPMHPQILSLLGPTYQQFYFFSD